MKTVVASTVLLGAILLLAAGSPSSAVACTGCDTSFEEFVDSRPVIMLVEYRGPAGKSVILEVIDVLMGHAPHTIKLAPAGVLGSRPWSRWLVAPVDGYLAEAFRVRSDGTVSNTTTGEGAVNGYPRTLAGWYRALGLEVPDTATSGPARLVPGATAAAEPSAPLLLISAALFGGAAGWGRARSPRLEPTKDG